MSKVYMLQYRAEDDCEISIELMARKSLVVERILELAAYPNSEGELAETEQGRMFVWTVEAWGRSDKDVLHIETQGLIYNVSLEEVAE